MRVIYLFPGPLSAVDRGEEELGRRGRILQGWAAPDTTVEVHDTTMGGGEAKGPVSFETGYEAYLTVGHSVPAFVEAEKAGYDVGILGCFGDPGLDAVRENLTRLPVVGPGAASCYMASMLGERFGIITTSRLFMTPCRRMISILGLENRAAGIEVVDAPPRELAADFDRTRQRIAEAAVRLQRAGADALVLGCMSMGFMNVTDELQEELGLPVVNPSGPRSIRRRRSFGQICVRARSPIRIRKERSCESAGRRSVTGRKPTQKISRDITSAQQRGRPS